MKKIKGLLVAFVALFVFTLAMVKASAETEDVVTKATINSASVTVDGITFTSSGMKTGVSITGTSLIDGTEKTYETGTKLNSGATLKFTAQYEWSAQVLVSSGTAGQSLKTSSGTPSVVTSNAANQLGVISITGGQPGEITLERGGSKEMWVFEIVLTQTKNLDAEYVDVYFHDVEGNAGAATPVEKGAKVTAAVAAPILGKQFVNWTLEDGTVFDFNTAINEETHLYPVYSDVAVSVADANVLSRDYLKSLLVVLPTMPVINEETAFTGTNYALAKGAGLMNNDSKKFPDESDQIVYGINTGGALNLTEAGVWTNAVKFTASSAGTFNIYGRSGNANPRKVAITTDNENFVYSAEVGQDNIELITVSVTAAGTYYIGCKEGGFKFYSIEFVAQAPQPTPSVSFYQQSGYNADGVELVRYIGIVENVAEADIPGSFSLVITGANIPGGSFDATSLCVIANRITNNGQTYVAEVNGANYEFGVKNNVLYVVCVLAVSNDGAALADQYKGTELTATLTVNGNQVGVKTYTVLGAQA